MELTDEIFTERTQAVKCCTLEIAPIGKTRETIEKKNLFEADAEITDRVKNLKPFIDRYVIFIIDKALSHTEDYDFITAYNAWEKSGKDEGKKAYNEICDRIKETALETLNAITGYPKTDFLTNEKFYDSEDFKAWKSEKCRDIPGYDSDADLKGLGTILVTTYRWTITSLRKWMPSRIIENMEIYFANMQTVERIAKEDNGLSEEIAELTTRYCLAENYAYCLTSKGINEYNHMISGDNSEEGIVDKGIGIWVNEQNQRMRNKNLKTPRYHAPKQLYKQILSPTPKAFTVDMIETNEEFLEVLSEDMSVAEVCCEKAKEIAEEMSEATTISGSSVNYLSARIFSGKEFEKFTKLIKDDLDVDNDAVRTGRYSMEYLSGLCGEDVMNLTKAAVLKRADGLLEKVNAIKRSRIKELATVKESDAAIRSVVELCDAVTEFRSLIADFAYDGDDADDFCLDCKELLEGISTCTKATNLMRNFATKSLKSEAKKRACLFGQSARFSSGWWTAEKKFSSRDLTVAKIDNKYYLLLVPGGGKPVDIKRDEKGTVQLYVTKKLQKMQFCIPATAFPNEVKKYFGEGNRIPYVLQKGMTEPVVITAEAWDIYSKRYAIKAEQEKNGLTDEQVADARTKLLTLYRKIVTKGTQFQKFDMKSLKNPEEYETIAEFNADAEAKNISMEWMPVSRKFIEQAVESGQLLMFLVRNQNMYVEGERGRRQQLTSYAETFLSIFSDKNMASPRLTINSAPSFFYRPKLIEPKVAHPKGSILVNKNDNEGKHIPTEIYAEIYHFYNGRLDRTEISADAKKLIDDGKIITHVAQTDIIKDAHYAREMFTMTFSYTINKQVTDNTAYSLNRDVEELLSEKSNIMVISKGTADLLYYIIYGKEGEIISEGDLNSVGDTDYREILRDYTYRRRNEKASMWRYDTKLAGVKDFYIKHVCGCIAELAVENNAVVVLEKTPERAREKWAMIDHQVFGKLEDALRVKFENYVLPHASDAMAPGGRLNPLQLSYDFAGYNKGALKLFPAAFCNLVDLPTGFINLLDTYDMNSIEKKRAFLSKFDEIRFSENGLIFAFDYRTEGMPIKSYGHGSEKVPLMDIKRLKKTGWTVTVRGARSLYDEKDRSYCYTDETDKYVHSVFIDAGDETGGNIAERIDRIKGTSVTALFEALTATLSGTVKAHDEMEEYRFSPVTNEYLGNTCRYKAMAMYSRFISFRNRKAAGDEDEGANEEWLNSLLNE